MSRSSCLALALIYILLSACATPYQPVGFSGGYSEMQLNQDRYVVTFRGNEFISKNRVNQYLLLRAAELTQQNGYRYFTVLSANEQERNRYVTTPTTTQATTNGMSTGTGYISGQTYVWNGTSNNFTDVTVNPGRTYKHTRYENSIVVQMFQKIKPGQNVISRPH